jgi:hypothetical protein
METQQASGEESRLDMPLDITAIDELTAAQIERIYGLGFVAGLTNRPPVHEDDPVGSYIQEIQRLQQKSEQHLKVISLQTQTIQRLKGDVLAMRIAMIILVLLVAILLVIVREQVNELIIQPTAVERDRRA